MRILIAIAFFSLTCSTLSKYELSSNVDMVLMPTSIISASIGNIMTYQEYPLTDDDFDGIDNLHIPFFDRWNTTYNSVYAEISDILLTIQLLSPLSYSFVSSFKNDFQTNAVMYFETISINYGINSITKALSKRFRPFTFDSMTAKEMLYQYDTEYSFYSGHSSTAFASAIFNILILTDNGGIRYKDLAIALNLLNATAIATLRVLAGKHFLSDVLVGAIVGSGLAYIITEVHKENNKSVENIVEPIRFGFSFPL